MRTLKKILIGLIILIALVVVAAAITLPLLLDVNRYRPEVAAHIREETGKPAEIGRLALSVFPALAIRVDDFRLGNPAGFPQGDFLKVRRVDVELDALALWDRRIVIRSLAFDAPVIRLLSDVRGRWNFESESHAGARNTPPRRDKPLFSLGVIARVSIDGAKLEAANLLASGRPGPTFFEARGVSIQLTQVDLNAFTASASLAGRPAPWLAIIRELTPTVHAASRSTPVAAGSLKAESLSFGALQATGVKTRLRLFPKQVYFDDLSFDLYGGRAKGALAVDLAPTNPRYSTHAQLSDVDVARLLAAFPDARGKMSGKMEGGIKLTGEVAHSPDPLAGLQGTGQVKIANGQLPSLQLNKNLALLARLSNLGPASGDPSSFSSISTDLNIANSKITSNKVIVIGNGVDVDGSGSLALAGAGSLDYQGVAKLAAGQSAVSNLLQGLTGATSENGKLSFPFSIAGTLENPRFLLKSIGRSGQLGALQDLVGAKTGQPLAAQPAQAQQPSDLVQGIAGLFKKKKPAAPPQPK